MATYYYVSYVEEYPIYEPAEGGYYYTGEQVMNYRKFSSWKKANKCFQKWKKAFLEEYDWAVKQDRVWVWDNPGVDPKDGQGSLARYSSRYIGEGASVQITRGPFKEHGYEPYC